MKKKELENDNSSVNIDGWTVPSLDYSSVRIVLLARLMLRITHNEFAKNTDIKYSEWRVLNQLMHIGSGTVKELSDQTWSDKGEVSRGANKLVTLGYLKKKDNPDDLRAPVFSITSTGKSIHKKIYKSRTKFHDTLTSDLSKNEIAVLDEVLSKIMNKIKIEYDI